MLLMRWLFLGVLAVLVVLILSIGWMNDSNRWISGSARFPDGQIVPPNDPGLVPVRPAQ